MADEMVLTKISEQMEAIDRGVKEWGPKIVIIENRIKDLEATRNKAAGFLGQEARNASSEDRFVSAEFLAGLIGKDPTRISRLRAEKPDQFQLPGLTTKATTDYFNYTSDNASGGYLVPTLIANEIAKITEQKSVLYPLVSKFPQGSPIYQLTTQSVKPTVTYRDEAVAKAAGAKQTFGRVTYTLKKPTCMMVLTNEQLEDNIMRAGLLDFTIEAMGAAFGRDFDISCFQDAASPYEGILHDTGVTSITMAETTADTGLSFDYLSQLIAAVSSEASGGAAFFMHRTVLHRLRREKDTTGQYIWAPPAAGMPGTILGYPVHLMENGAPTLAAATATVKFLVFGDMSYARCGEAKALTFKMSDVATVTLDATDTSMFQSNMLAILGEARRSFAVAVPAAFAKLICHA